MTSRVGPKGQVVIPKELRVQLGLRPGDEVTIWRHGDHVSLRPVHRPQPLKGRLAGSDLVGALERDRAADQSRDQER